MSDDSSQAAQAISYPHCCECGSMQHWFDETQHGQVCGDIANEQDWPRPCPCNGSGILPMAFEDYDDD